MLTDTKLKALKPRQACLPRRWLRRAVHRGAADRIEAVAASGTDTWHPKMSND